MMKQLFDKTAPQNVHGWERAASLAGGLVMMGKGLRRGGLIGLAELAMGGMALARGISVAPGPIFSASQAFGHCLRLNYGHDWSDETGQALATLGELARAMQSLPAAKAAG